MSDEEALEDLSQKSEGEESKYRSYVRDAEEKKKAPQKFKIGRIVWLKTDRDGAYRMTICDAFYNAQGNTWSYALKDSMGADYEERVVEKNLTAANPAK